MTVRPTSADVSRPPLAILGGAPAFAEPLHVGRPYVGDREAFLARVADMFDRGWLTNDGPLVREFERKIAGFVGVRHCVATCNATTALGIAIRALALSGEVIIPSYTFIATAHALQWQGITPVFADIDPRTHNIDPLSVERLISTRTTGIIGVHLWGRPCDTDALGAIAARHSLRLMYDCAHGFGCSHQARMLGGFGACEVFSFHATKFLHSFEGGAMVTDDGELADRMRLMRNFGFSALDSVSHLGINGKMTEVCAAMGLSSLESMDYVVAINQRNDEGYRRGLEGLEGLSTIRRDDAERHNFQHVVVDVSPESASLSRDELVEVLQAENVLARRYFWPGCHRMEPYRSLQPHAGRLLPETERLAPRVMLLPTGPAITAETVERICELVATALAQPDVVRSALAERARRRAADTDARGR